MFNRSDLLIVSAAVVAIGAAGVTRYAHLGDVTAFGCAALAVALLASLVGRSVEQLGERLGSGGTGVLQSALGNLPELFIGFFALKAGLTSVVQASIIGSMLANLLLVLGAAFLVGGLKHGSQKFDSAQIRMTMVLLLLATAALVMPAIAHGLHAPVSQHEKPLSIVISVVLLAIFALSLPASLKRRASTDPVPAGHEPPRWPLWLAVSVLAGASVAAALVSDWFVHALEPAMGTLHISPAFAGLVIVAIAGNAIENVVGIQLAARNQMDFAVSVIINSPLQIALLMAPMLVLLSLFTATTLTLVFTPLLVAAVLLTVLTVAIAMLDGESNWLEGAVMIALYAIIATMFWWG
ncbi:calcium/proton exchanger [Longispora fulva]|uniref:Ca(2+)/H(+) antiporter n=1 Tax=Longispora fulva TaxID=619741 RepID=A0A8J7G8Q4_9ACTN|nr:calcium/proton exchanger [Longispora fulva]MBG6135010.1 Ca2+:H+ antiporter [Longispora fulva]GIG56756.1 calcium/proton exchanger [Longispora fulva]